MSPRETVELRASDGLDQRARVLTVCPFVPGPDLPHAGGQYLWAHVSSLSERYECRLLAPDTTENRAALGQAAQIIEATLAEARKVKFGGLVDRPRQLMWTLTRPLQPEQRHRGALVRELARMLPDTDIVELQWPEYAGLIPVIRHLAPDVPVVVVEHDVLSQRVARDRDAPTRRTRLRARLTAARVGRLERRYLDLADRVLVFSQKDADLLTALGVQTPTEVVEPPLEDVRMWSAPPSPRGEVEARILLVAAFGREVNDAAARWFLHEVFPRIRNAVSHVELVLAGSGMRADLQELADGTPGVSRTGYVEDLGELYGRAEVAVAPLHAGAGLKFKVATAMMWGLPVVSTTVGAEGYPSDQDLFIGIADEAEPFADFVVDALTRRDLARTTAARAQAWARSTFSDLRFRAHLISIYGQLAPVAAPRGPT